MKPHLKKLKVFGDDRGLFFPLSLENHYDRQWLQSNISISKKHTFRGLHHQRGNTSQSKLVTVIQGEILDFIVDLRHGSFEETYFFQMSPGDQLYVPRGFAHGFLALREDTMIQYLVDNVYSPETEMSFDWKSNETVKELILAEVGREEMLLMTDKDREGTPISREWVEREQE
jgi:dTDP-4-dehydrorhamnose 3,5-epimerase